MNEKLDSMGYGIGQRLIDELLAKSNVGQVLHRSRLRGVLMPRTGATAFGPISPAAMHAQLRALERRARATSGASYCSSPPAHPVQ